jgi:hypothetical protein
MLHPAGHRGTALGLAALAAYFMAAGCAIGSRPVAVTPRAADWRIEAEQAAFVTFGDVIDIETPAGLSLWYMRELKGPVAIEYDALAVSEGGANDQVSDLNAFWMARDPRVRGGSVFAKKRLGAFADYDDLKTYYVGHDLSGAENMLVPNRWTHVRLIADGRHIAVERDGRRIFELDDPEPYRRGWFALRTTKSHLRIRNLRIGKP